MVNESPLGRLSGLGTFRGATAIDLGITRKQLMTLRAKGLIEREFPDTYRMAAIPRSNEQRLRAALLWAGDGAAAAGRSAGELYGLEGVRADSPEIVVFRTSRKRSDGIVVHRCADRAALLVRRHRGIPVTGPEPTLLALAGVLDSEPFEIACEDARRHLLVSNGITDFAREFPLEWNGRTYLFDFCFERQRTILETNGRRWHDDAADYEHDNEKWSVPGRHDYRLVLATWSKVNDRPRRLLDELAVTLAFGSRRTAE
jgi:hypothetical protein